MSSEKPKTFGKKFEAVTSNIIKYSILGIGAFVSIVLVGAFALAIIPGTGVRFGEGTPRNDN